jgi:GTP-binding protein
MPGQFVATLGDASQLADLFTGPFLKGRSEPRMAMVGRSNVGKSSLINALLKAKVAQVSKEPGKTRSIHFYAWLDAKKIMADLPGYGYAKTGHEERNRWAQFIEAYFKFDEHLERAVVLLDSRHGPTEIDLDAIQFLRKARVPITFVMTKADQLKTQSDRASRKKEVAAALKDLGYKEENAFWVSVETENGLRELTKNLIAVKQVDA